MKQMKLGTIGSGVIVRSILDGVKVTEGISLEAVYSRTEEKGRELAEAYGAEKVYTDLEAFLSDDELNFIYVASPNNLHYEQVKEAFLHGKNVICEKPLCPRREQVEELAALAEEKGLLLVDATPTAFLPNLDIIKEWLLKVGRVRLVTASYCQYSSRYDKLLEGEVPNVFSPEFAGGCLQDINYYNIYLNVTLFGKPESAVYYPNLCRTGVDTSGIAVLRYPDFVSECTGAKDTWGDNMVQIQGEKGYLCIDGGANGLTNVRLVTKEGEASRNLQENPDRWLYEVQNMTKMLLEEDHETIRERLKITAAVIEVMENMRKDAGILFPGE
ncbi:gfo/Idh/MocA family oxidoreductase [bacterium C-53]|nr:gfo/Idh/MocA family oxidoreductase [Lachnospiraceae bacterium]NBI03796.1 gfo/Idh/MocA family oxidoreductase [Lachnospiraceae bacterium]RKJ09143.1 gfo/Idh/MocA family oxidoreductase [bacterium C-53]